MDSRPFSTTVLTHPFYKRKKNDKKKKKELWERRQQVRMVAIHVANQESGFDPGTAEALPGVISEHSPE